MKCSLGISNFLEEISSLSHSIVFLYFFALIGEEGFLISPCYSSELCIQMGISFIFSLLSASLLSTAIWKASSDSHLAFLHFFFLGIVLIPVSCIVIRWGEDHIFIRLWNRLASLKEDGLNVLPGNILEYDLNFQVSLNDVTPIYLHVRIFKNYTDWDKSRCIWVLGIQAMSSLKNHLTSAL